MHASTYLAGHSMTCIYPDRTPILSVSGVEGDTFTLYTGAPTVITADELAAVRTLRRAVERFADECERIATEQGVA